MVAPVTTVPSLRRGGDKRSVPSFWTVRWDLVRAMRPLPQAGAGIISGCSWEGVWLLGSGRDTLGSSKAVAAGVGVFSILDRDLPGRANG